MTCRNSSLVEGEILGPPGCCCDFAFLVKALCRWPLGTPVDQSRTRQPLLSLQSRCLWMRHLQSKAELCYQSFIRLPFTSVLMVLLTICLLFSLQQFQQLISLCPWVFSFCSLIWLAQFQLRGKRVATMETGSWNSFDMNCLAERGAICRMNPHSCLHP